MQTARPGGRQGQREERQHGGTPLHCAAVAAMQTALVEAGANERQGHERLAPLHYAAVGGHADGGALGTPGPGVRSRPNGWAPLHYAAANGHVDCVRALWTPGLTNSKDGTDGGHHRTARPPTVMDCVRVLSRPRPVNAGSTNADAAALRQLGPRGCVRVRSQGRRTRRKTRAAGHRCTRGRGRRGLRVRPSRRQGQRECKGQHERLTPLHCAAANGHAGCVHVLVEAMPT